MSITGNETWLDQIRIGDGALATMIARDTPLYATRVRDGKPVTIPSIGKVLDDYRGLVLAAKAGEITAPASPPEPDNSALEIALKQVETWKAECARLETALQGRVDNPDHEKEVHALKETIRALKLSEAEGESKAGRREITLKENHATIVRGLRSDIEALKAEVNQLVENEPDSHGDAAIIEEQQTTILRLESELESAKAKITAMESVPVPYAPCGCETRLAKIEAKLRTAFPWFDQMNFF